MAEGAILSVAQSIIRSLATAALKEMGQPWGLKQQLQELRDTMSAMEAVLRDAEDQHASSHQAIDWVSKLEDTLYKADDLVDAIGTEALGRRVRFGGKNSNTNVDLPTLFANTSKVDFILPAQYQTFSIIIICWQT
uniref:Disease resistance N-terminal domain-containing protein n=1 Tax=Cannabis sativa TaxID=3483 RepID=A0A803NI97_CANSA